MTSLPLTGKKKKTPLQDLGEENSDLRREISPVQRSQARPSQAVEASPAGLSEAPAGPHILYEAGAQPSDSEYTVQALTARLQSYARRKLDKLTRRKAEIFAQLIRTNPSAPPSFEDKVLIELNLIANRAATEFLPFGPGNVEKSYFEQDGQTSRERCILFKAVRFVYDVLEGAITNKLRSPADLEAISRNRIKTLDQGALHVALGKIFTQLQKSFVFPYIRNMGPQNFAALIRASVATALKCGACDEYESVCSLLTLDALKAENNFTRLETVRAGQNANRDQQHIFTCVSINGRSFALDAWGGKPCAFLEAEINRTAPYLQEMLETYPYDINPDDINYEQAIGELSKIIQDSGITETFTMLKFENIKALFETTAYPFNRAVRERYNQNAAKLTAETGENITPLSTPPASPR